MEMKEFKKLLQEAKNGNAHAMYLVALEYELGIVVEKDMEEAIDWMNESADLGDKDAKAWLDDYYFDDDAGVQAHS